MVKKVFVIALFALALASTFNSCYYDNEEELYAATATCITAIISQSCLSGCHEQAVGSAGIVLEGYTNLKNEIINGTVMCAIRHEGCSPMPKNQNKLSDCDINNLQNWIDKGYPEN
jgi:hypothetical protein